MDADKFRNILSARGRVPALVNDVPTLLTNNSTVGAKYISARGFLEELSKRGLTIDEATLKISIGQLVMVENDVPPAPVATTQEPPASEWEGISLAALKKLAKAHNVAIPSTPKRAEIISALEAAGVHKA